MYENDPNYKGIKSIAEIPTKEKEMLGDVHQIDYDLLGNPTTLQEAALWQALMVKQLTTSGLIED